MRNSKNFRLKYQKLEVLHETLSFNPDLSNRIWQVYVVIDNKIFSATLQIAFPCFPIHRLFTIYWVSRRSFFMETAWWSNELGKLKIAFPDFQFHSAARNKLHFDDVWKSICLQFLTCFSIKAQSLEVKIEFCFYSSSQKLKLELFKCICKQSTLLACLKHRKNIIWIISMICHLTSCL